MPNEIQESLMKLNQRQIDYEYGILNNINTKNVISRPLVDKLPFGGGIFNFNLNEELRHSITEDIKWETVRISFFNNLITIRLTNQFAINSIQILKSETESTLEVIESLMNR